MRKSETTPGPDACRTRTKPVSLSGRLMAIVELAGTGGAVCDVGCDHAHVPIRLLQNGQFPRAIGMDVLPGPLEKAAGNLALYGMEDRLELRHSDGLDAFCPGEADTLIVTGMGGRLMREILLREPQKTVSFSALVLGPQSEPDKVRSSLRGLMFRITDERLIFEDGKYYPVIRAQKAQTPFDQRVSGIRLEAEDLFGPVLLWRRDPVLYEFLVRRRAVFRKILRSVKGAADESAEGSEQQDAGHSAREKEILHILDVYREALSLYGA